MHTQSVDIISSAKGVTSDTLVHVSVCVCVCGFIHSPHHHVKSQHVREVIKDDALCLLKGQALSDVFNIWEQEARLTRASSICERVHVW
jgi:hypothetical protein